VRCPKGRVEALDAALKGGGSYNKEFSSWFSPMIRCCVFSSSTAAAFMAIPLLWIVGLGCQPQWALFGKT